MRPSRPDHYYSSGKNRTCNCGTGITSAWPIRGPANILAVAKTAKVPIAINHSIGTEY